jgi:uncharacterized membrane protein
MDIWSTAILLAALGSAIIGGIFFAFSTFIMAALAARPPAEGMAAMVSIDRVILRSLFMPVFFGTALLSVVLAAYALIAWRPASPWLIGAALLYLLLSILSTMVFNVPLNNAIERADPAADNQALWADYLQRWTRWNHVRTIASLAAAGLFVGALLV